MRIEQIENSELDRIVSNILKSNDKLIIPAGLPEKVIRKLEKKVTLRNLVVELTFKVGLVFISIAILTGVFLWIKGSGVLTGLYIHFNDNWQIITLLLFVGFLTILFDQIGLRFLDTCKKEQV